MTVRELRQLLFDVDNQDMEVMVAVQLYDHSRTVVAFNIEENSGEIMFTGENGYAEAYGGYGAKGLHNPFEGDSEPNEDYKPTIILTLK
jgi:hypothetical protein